MLPAIVVFKKFARLVLYPRKLGQLAWKGKCHPLGNGGRLVVHLPRWSPTGHGQSPPMGQLPELRPPPL